MTLQPTILGEIKEAQGLDPSLVRIRKEVMEGKETNFGVSDEGILHFKGRLCVPNNEELRKQILSEAHDTPYSIHPGVTKIYKDLKEYFW